MRAWQRGFGECCAPIEVRWTRISAFVLAALFFGLNPLAGQRALTVQGRVVSGGQPVAGASVEVRGFGSTLVKSDGTFQFNNLRTGQLSFRIAALGFETQDFDLLLRRDTTVVIEMVVRPVRVDSLVVKARTYTVQGYVFEQATGYRIFDADVFVRPVANTQTRVGGRFKVSGIRPGEQLVVEVEAAGFEPATSKVVLDNDTTLVFQLVKDPVGQRMINAQTARLADRSNGLGYSLRKFDRDEILHSRVFSARDIVAAYLGHNVSRVRCVLIDEQTQDNRLDALDSYVLDTVQRIEIIDRGAMVRVYTTRFYKQMLEGRIELHPIIMISGTGGPFCT